MKAKKATRRSTLVLLGSFIALVAALIGVQSAASKPAVSTPTITTKPNDPVASTSASFAFTGPSAATFKCGMDGSILIACTSPKSYATLAQGSHTFRVVATLGGSDSTESAYTWRVDTVAPPAPSFTGGPNGPVNSTNATFTFSDPEAGVAFQCAVDGGATGACTSPVIYSSLTQGAHTLALRAVDAAGNSSVATTRSWSGSAGPACAPTSTRCPARSSTTSSPRDWTRPSPSVT